MVPTSEEIEALVEILRRSTIRSIDGQWIDRFDAFPKIIENGHAIILEQQSDRRCRLSCCSLEFSCVACGNNRFWLFVIEGDQRRLQWITANGHQYTPNATGNQIRYTEGTFHKSNLEGEEKNKRKDTDLCFILLFRSASLHHEDDRRPERIATRWLPSWISWISSPPQSSLGLRLRSSPMAFHTAHACLAAELWHIDLDAPARSCQCRRYPHWNLERLPPGIHTCEHDCQVKSHWQTLSIVLYYGIQLPRWHALGGCMSVALDRSLDKYDPFQ